MYKTLTYIRERARERERWQDGIGHDRTFLTPHWKTCKM